MAAVSDRRPEINYSSGKAIDYELVYKHLSKAMINQNVNIIIVHR